MKMADVTKAIDEVADAIATAPAGIPLQRRFRNLRVQLIEVLDTGYPIKRLADDLAARGVVTGKGLPISYEHLRVILSRCEPQAAPVNAAVQQSRGGVSRPNVLAPAPRTDKKVAPDFSGGLFGRNELPKRRD